MTNAAAITLTHEYRRRIISSIEECQRFIDKEDPRDATLRPPEVAELLQRYKAHRARLEKSLKDGFLIPENA